MANLSNINNKFIVQDNSKILVNKTSDTGATLQVGGSLSTDTSVRVGNGVLYVGDGSTATARIMGFGDTEMITGVSGATYLRVSGTSTLAGTLQAGQYILASGLAYGAVNSYTQIINGSTGAITGTTSNFVSSVAGTTVVSAEGAYASSGSVKIFEAKRNGGAVKSDWDYHDSSPIRMSIGTSTSHSFAIKTADTPRLTIESSGDVGIGTDSPAQKLDVVGKMKISDDIILAQTNGRLDYDNGNSNGALRFFSTSGNTERMRITSAGKVGIGTTSPDTLLHIYNPDTNWGAYSVITLGTDVEGTNQAQLKYYRGASTSTESFQLSVRGTTALTALYNGNVGIGVDPSGNTDRLQIDNPSNPTSIRIGDNTTDDCYIIFNTDGNDWSIGADRSDSNKFKISDYSRVGTNDRLTIDTSGNVGIGTTDPRGKGLEIFRAAGNSSHPQLIISTGESGSKDYGISTDVAGAGDFAIVDGVTNVAANVKLLINSAGNVGIGTTGPNYNLEIGGAANPVVAIVSNINSATSSLYFGDSDAKDRGQVRYTHFGDFMELKAGGATRVYIESGINTAYTADGLFNSNATPSYWNHGNGQFKLGYMDNGSGLYSGAYCFNVKSTDGIPVTGREIGAIYVRDTSNNRMPLIISNQGRININQTNTSTSFGSSTGWLTIANGTSAYNFYNAYTGTDGSSGCARYRLNNTSPSFFDFYYTTTQVGYITTNGTDIFYANTSDYRLKEDLKSFDGMSLLEKIQVYDFKWKESDNRMYGVVAHELQDVVPQAVVGNKDEEKLQAVDYSKLVPILIKSIQELKAEIELLKNN